MKKVPGKTGTAKAFKSMDKAASIKDMVAALHNDKLSNDKEQGKKLKGVQTAIPLVIAFESRQLMENVINKFVSYQAQNVPQDNWVKLVGSRDCKLSISGDSTAVKAAFDEATRIKKLEESNLQTSEEAHIKVTAKGQAYFQQGDIRFEVDSQDLNKVLGTNGETSPLSHLMDSQISALAQANHIPAQPFVRELILQPIVGVLQMVWYRDLQGHMSEHLVINQRARIERYMKALKEYKEPSSAENGSSGVRRAPRTSVKNSLLSKTFTFVGVTESVASGRETDLLGVIKKLKKASFSQIVEAAKGVVKTKQDFEAIVARFLRELVEHGAVREV